MTKKELYAKCKELKIPWVKRTMKTADMQKMYDDFVTKEVSWPTPKENENESKSESSLEKAMAMMMKSQIETNETLKEIKEWINKLWNQPEKKETKWDKVWWDYNVEYEYEVQGIDKSKWLDKDWKPAFQVFWSRYKDPNKAREYWDRTFWPNNYRVLNIPFRTS